MLNRLTCKLKCFGEFLLNIIKNNATPTLADVTII